MVGALVTSIKVVIVVVAVVVAAFVSMVEVAVVIEKCMKEYIQRERLATATVGFLRARRKRRFELNKSLLKEEKKP